jgi:hypothetical protein
LSRDRSKLTRSKRSATFWFQTGTIPDSSLALQESNPAQIISQKNPTLRLTWLRLGKREISDPVH